MNDLQIDNVATDIAVIKVMEFPNEVTLQTHPCNENMVFPV